MLCPTTNLDLLREDFISFFGLFLSLKIYSLYFLLSDEDRLLSFSLLRSSAGSTRPSSMNVDPSDILVPSFFMILISFPFFFQLPWVCALLHYPHNSRSARQRMQPNCRIMAEQDYAGTMRTNATFAVDALQTQDYVV